MSGLPEGYRTVRLSVNLVFEYCDNGDTHKLLP